MRRVKIFCTGSYVPDNVVTNKQLEERVDTDAKWIYENLGIKERRVVDVNEKTSNIAYYAGMQAVYNADISVDDIDMIIVATATPDYQAPSTACLVQNKMKAKNAVCFDVSAVCSGFLYAMSIASQYISTETHDNILVIGADTFSSITDWDRRDCVFFGDGAGAAILTHSDKDGFIDFNLESDGSGWDNFVIHDNGKFSMNGKAVYDTATHVLPKSICEILERNSMTVDDVDMVIPHQPSIKILQRTAELIDIPFDKVKTNMERYANTSAGTIPILLDELNKSESIENGDIILFMAIGSGWTYGTAILKWI